MSAPPYAGFAVIVASRADPENLVHIDVNWHPHAKGDLTRAAALELAKTILRELSDMPHDRIQAIRLRLL